MIAQTLMRAATRALSLSFGGSGVFFLWASFYTPSSAAYALVFLSTATVLAIAEGGTR